MHKKSNEGKRKKKIIAAISILFYLGMLFMAVGARRLHRDRLPQVTVTVPTMKTFMEGDSISAALTLPEKLVKDGVLFVVSEEMINGELRTIARQVNGLEIDRVSDGYCEIVTGLSSLAQVIVDGKEELADGDEVLVKGEWSDAKD